MSNKDNTTDVVRNLGVHLDSELSMKQHVAKVASVCFYLPHSPSAPDPPTRRTGSHDPTRTRHDYEPPRLL